MRIAFGSLSERSRAPFGSVCVPGPERRCSAAEAAYYAELNVFQIPGSPVHPDRPSESYEPVGSCKPVQSFGTAQSFRTVQSYDPVQTYGPVHRGAPADSRENGHDGGLPERAKAGTGPRNDGSTMYNASNALHNTVSRNYVNIGSYHIELCKHPGSYRQPKLCEHSGNTDIRNQTSR